MSKDNFTISETLLNVGQNINHQLYVEEWGNQAAAHTFINLHGGPGSGTGTDVKDNFDPRTQHVIFYDQRGAGKSRPAEEIRENTTDDLVADLLTILDYFGLEKVTLVGRSWGSTLALIFAERYPERVENLVVGGVFLADDFSTKLLTNGAYRLCYPDVWEAFKASVPSEFQSHPADFYLEKVKNTLKQNTDEPDFAGLAAPYDRTERSVAYLAGQPIDLAEPIKAEELRGANFEMLYTARHFFIKEGEILENVKKLTMPIFIIQGRYDMVCPPAAAWKLVKTLEKIGRAPQLTWTVAGHAGTDPENLAHTRAVLAEIAKSEDENAGL